MRSVVRHLALAGTILCASVIVLGAWVRLTDAGLGCPDWPTCYGALAPTSAALDPEKAWHEMIHRYAAAALGLVVVALAAIAIAKRKERAVSLSRAVALLAIVVAQGLLGALTVWWLVKPVIVLLHLLGGLTTLALLFGVWLDARERRDIPPWPEADAPFVADARRFAWIGLAALVAQIALGAWTSSNYAAVACPDVPRCQGTWWPEMDPAAAFVLWRGLGVDYTGGVLELPARTAIHVAHRAGAVVAALSLFTATLLALRIAARSTRNTIGLRRSAWLLTAALATQIVLGVAMVEEGLPIATATAHSAGAAILLLATIFFQRQLRAPPLPDTTAHLASA